MVGRRALIASAIILLFLLPVATSTIIPNGERGGYDADGRWTQSHELEIHTNWWLDWSRDKDGDSLDDRLEWMLDQPEEFQLDWWRKAGPGFARVFVDYDHHPSNADVRAIEDLGAIITSRPMYLDTLSVTVPFEIIHSENGILSLMGVVMIEDIGLAETHMNEAVPNMGVDSVWADFGYIGTGVTIAVLDTGVRGDHEGLNDMDDDPFTCIDDPPDPLDPNPGPIPADCDPKVKAFYDAVYTHSEQPAEDSFDSGTHGTHVSGIAAGTGGGQTAADGSRYIGAAPGAWVINILACCEGDIEDIIEGAEWAIDNKDRLEIDILTSSLGEQQFEVHFDNDGSSAWSRQMDAVADSGIITTLSAGNEFGGVTFAGCNTIDSPGDAQLPVTVASLDKNLELAIYSSRGYTSDGRVKPDVSTIGSSIMAPDAATQDGYTSKSGTSMATPLMAGIAALMVEANPDLTHAEFKEIISVHSIERDISIGGDPGFNDCSLLESRPDNEFGYGQADPLAFVEAAGSIDRSLNVSMDIETMDEIGNESYISGIASGVIPGSGLVEVRVGGGEWKDAADLSKSGDWSTWKVKLDPHLQSGNTTIYARLVFSEDSISPVDARRVILVDEVVAGGISGDLIRMNSLVFFIPFILVLGVLGNTVRRERWNIPWTAVDVFSDRDGGEIGLFYTIRKLPSSVIAALIAVVSFPKFAIPAWRNGSSLIDNQFRRYTSLSILYFAQGIPAGFTSVTFLAYLSLNGTPPGELAALMVAISLPWTFKWIWGPVIDMIQIPKYGLRRPWILFAQTGMAVSLGGLLFVSDMNSQISLVTKILFVHNLFSSLQDVGVDALAVDILQPDEVAKANGFMFASKRFGIIFSGAILGATLIKYYSIKAVVVVQLPLILLIMALPLFLRERPGDSLFPWHKSSLNSEMEQYLESIDELIEDKDWDLDQEYHVASWVGSNLYQKRITVGALLLWLGLTTELFSFGCSILQILLENPTLEFISDHTATLGHILLLGAIIFLIIERYSESITVFNPFFLIPESGRSNFAATGYNITKGFSLRSSLLLIVVCLLSELYVFTSPIVIDIFVNEAGWSVSKYSAVMGGIVLGFTIIGQVLGGFLGDKFGVREVAMVGFTMLGLANAFLAILSSFWENTPLMIFYLCFQAFISGIAWICIISVSMRLTYSKAGGSQFTAYMSMFNLSAIIAYSFTQYMVVRYEYNTAIYIGAALTLITVLILVFIDVDECDRVLEGRFDDDDEGGEGPTLDAILEVEDFGETASITQ
jgi:subtilisin family serine protease/MFS family permease